MADTDWRREADPRFKYKWSELRWLSMLGFTTGYGILWSEMIEISGSWALDY